MTASKNKIFTFTWHIENFSMCPKTSKEWIESSIFAIDFLGDTKWAIWLYPHGDGDENAMSVYLQRKEDVKASEISYMFTIISADPKKNIKSSVGNRNFTNVKPSWGFRNMCLREAIFNGENAFLGNDILTINCHMWEHGIDEDYFNDVIALRNEKCPILRNISNVNQGSALTRINMESKSVLLTIERFSEMQCNQKLVKTVTSARKNGPTLDLIFYLKKSREDQHVHLDIKKKGGTGFFVRCNMKTFGAPKGIQYQREAEHHFRSQQKDVTWEFPVFIKRKKIIEDKYLYYTDDVLYLHCEFNFSVEGEYCNIMNSTSIPVERHSKNVEISSPIHFYQTLCNDEEFSDATIRTGERDFKVHKCILATRSPVFKAILETNVTEKENGIINITDFKVDIVEKMINFMYSDTLEGMSQTDITSLYYAANKYDVITLKCRCRCILMSNLSACNAGEVLELADLCDDEELIEAVRSFIHLNTDDVFHSTTWKNFMQNHIQSALNMTIRILTDKYLDSAKLGM